jgi:hypothetical protein
MLYVHSFSTNWLERYFFGTSHLSWILNSLVFIIILRWIIWPLVLTPLLDIWDFRKQAKSTLVAIELTPPSVNGKTQFASEELFKIVHNFYATQSIKDQLLRRRQVISCEIVSTHKDGIRFLIKVPHTSVKSFERLMISYLPELKFKLHEGHDSFPRHLSVKCTTFKQSSSFVFPLRRPGRLLEHDPMRYLLGALSKPESGEVLKLQLLLTPYTSSQASKLLNQMNKGVSPVAIRTSRGSAFSQLRLCVKIIISFFVFFYNFSLFLVNLFAGNPTLKVARNSRADVAVDHSNEGLSLAIKKLGEPLFYSDIRVFVASKNSVRASDRLRTIASSLSTLDEPGYQALVPRNISLGYFRQSPDSTFSSVFRYSSNILSASEVASIYHFPYGRVALSEGVVQSTSKTLPAPNAMKRNNQNGSYDVVLGQNVYHGKLLNIGLTKEERKRHMYIVGGTGNGKTTLLEYAIEQDIRKGKGVAVIDPHGDLAQKILNYIPKERLKDVIYFNPSDLEFPVGINLLELPKGLTESELLNEKDFVTEAIVSMFRKIFSDDDSGGHRIEYILRNAIHTAMTIEDATLFTILKLLRNTSYRKSVTSKLVDEELKDFWREELGKAGDFQRVKMSAGITSKIDRFRHSASVKIIINQKKSTINFDEVLDGKILICNLAKGLVGEDTSELLGISILTKLQLATYRRIRKNQAARAPFFLYVDEFQNFATTQFIQMLSEARKYGLVLTMAEQSTSQQDQKMVEVILNNIGTLVCFRTGSAHDEQMLLPQFTPYVQEGEIGNLPAYNFYIRIRATEAYEPTSGKTVQLEVRSNKRLVNRVISNSRKRYALKSVVTESSTPVVEEALAKKTEVPSLLVSKQTIELID